jgi:hypothetical protein
MIHECHEPQAVLNLLDADALASKDLAQVDLSGVEADAAAGGDDDALSRIGRGETAQVNTAPKEQSLCRCG